MLFLLCSAMLFAGKPTPQPTYVWKVVLVDGGDVYGGDDLGTATNLATQLGCTDTTDRLCTELVGKAGWVFNPADASMNVVVRDPGYLFYPGFTREAQFTMRMSAAEGHKHVKFRTLDGSSEPRLSRTGVSGKVTTTYMPATFCFVEFMDTSSDPDFVKCVVESFLAFGQHPAPDSGMTFAFYSSGDLMDNEPNENYLPATFFLTSALSADYPACNLEKANLAGKDYPNIYPRPVSDTELESLKGAFIRRVTMDSWKVEIRAGFDGINPFPANPKPDDVVAACAEWPSKFTKIVYENTGRMQMTSTMYFVRTQVK